MAHSSDPPSWRNCRRPRIWTRPIGWPRKNDRVNMYSGYPADVIAEWCSIALSTAYAYKTGCLKPSKPEARLTGVDGLGPRFRPGQDDGCSRNAKRQLKPP